MTYFILLLVISLIPSLIFIKTFKTYLKAWLATVSTMLAIFLYLAKDNYSGIHEVEFWLMFLVIFSVSSVSFLIVSKIHNNKKTSKAQNT